MTSPAAASHPVGAPRAAPVVIRAPRAAPVSVEAPPAALIFHGAPLAAPVGLRPTPPVPGPQSPARRHLTNAPIGRWMKVTWHSNPVGHPAVRVGLRKADGAVLRRPTKADAQSRRWWRDRVAIAEERRVHVSTVTDRGVRPRATGRSAGTVGRGPGRRGTGGARGPGMRTERARLSPDQCPLGVDVVILGPNRQPEARAHHGHDPVGQRDALLGEAPKRRRRGQDVLRTGGDQDGGRKDLVHPKGRGPSTNPAEDQTVPLNQRGGQQGDGLSVPG